MDQTKKIIWYSSIFYYGESMIDLYTAPTPNGHKVSCTLEAMELEYEIHVVNLMENEQK